MEKRIKLLKSGMRDITTFLTEIVLQNNTINNNTQTY